ncbi:MAG TPA: type II toxin-antitoxin system VapB family antitoxin [bacterium]
MRTTLNLDTDLMKKAARLTGISQKTALIHRGLEALIQQESGRRLARLGGSMPSIRPIRRRRTERLG